MASTVLVASPALAATADNFRIRGAGLSASFSNISFDEGKELPPGEYNDTYIDAGSSVSIGTNTHSDYVCVSHWEFTVEDDGRWIDGLNFYACGPADTLTVDRRLSAGHVAASFQVEDCLTWDETGECAEVVFLGDLAVDVVLAGSGDVERVHGVWIGGSSSQYQFVYSGSGSGRSANPSGTVTFDGASLIDGATVTSGSLLRTQTGYVEVTH
jgi:hypothetical protein